MSEQNLNPTDVDTILKQVRGRRIRVEISLRALSRRPRPQ